MAENKENKKKYMTIDNILVEIEGEKNLLDLMRKVNIDLPTFCYHSYLSVYGACRMCMVENDKGGIEAACSTPPREGMVIHTNTERLRRYRKNILELLLANHCRDCTSCEKNKSCTLQDFAMRFGIRDVRFPNDAVSTREHDTSSFSISRDHGKCIRCGDCVRMCSEIQHVGAIDFSMRGSKMRVTTAFDEPIGESQCVGCGQCAAVCPTGAITVKNEIDKVWRAIDDPDTKVVVQIAPAVRVGLGRELGFKDGDDVMGKAVAVLRRMGVDEIFDTTFGADMTVIEEASEFVGRLELRENLPLFTSCCPAWVQFAEHRYPQLLPHISTCRSPMQMFASVIRSMNENGGRKLFHVAIMPCTAKKFEAAREEFSTDGKPNVDVVLTTQELARMIKETGAVFHDIEPEAVDMPFGTISGAGLIFGVTGGVTEAVLRNVVPDKSRNALASVSHIGQRGLDAIKIFELPYGDRNLRIAVVSGLGSVDKIITLMEEGEKFDLVEVMACPNGCISGGGQPHASSQQRGADRSAGLYQADKMLSIRRSEENPIVTKLFNEVINGREHELLHTHYVDRSQK